MTPFLGIDIGATWIKSAVLDIGGGAVSHLNRVPFPPSLPGRPEGHCEVDPDVVVALVRAEIDRLRRIVPRPGGIVLCGQMHGVVLMRDGVAVSPYYSPWDRRTAAPGAGSCEELRGLGGYAGAEWRVTGNELRPGIGVATLYWLRRHDALPCAAAPLTIADFVAMALTGARRPTLHPTQAAGLGARVLRTGDWTYWPLRDADLRSLGWPSTGTSVIGDHDGIPVWCAVGDHQCALLGAGLLPGDLSVNVGTGAQVAVLIDRPDPGDAQVRPWFDDKTWLRCVTHLRCDADGDAGDYGLLERLTRAADRLAMPWTLVVASGGLLRARPDLCDALRERFAPAVFVPPRDTDETLIGLLALARRWTA